VAGVALKFSEPARIAIVFAGLAVANAGVWAWAFAAFHGTPVLLGTALLAYGLGLRHAVDADHIAAIDNVTRKLMQDGKRPVAVGLFFSLGHASIVVAASAAVAVAAGRFGPRLEAWHAIGGVLGTLMSAAFLLAIAAANLLVLLALRRTRRRLRAGEIVADDSLNQALAGRGPLSRLLRPVFAMIGRSWHMYPLGVLFGLGFDTATEVALLGMSAAEARDRLPVLAVMVFPALFTAGMALVDTADGVLMLGAYGWAFAEPRRKLGYNIAITLLSVIVALAVGGAELLGLAGAQWTTGSANWSALGALIAGVFAVGWAGSALAARVRRPAQAVAASPQRL
jgi:high-affinity nickel-transport protein